MKRRELIKLAKTIVDSAQGITPVRTDYQPMNGISPSQLPPERLIRRFGAELAIMAKFCHGGVSQEGIIQITKDRHTEWMFYQANIADAFKLTTCSTGVAYVLHYLVQQKKSVPFTIMTFCNYEHQFAVLGIDADEEFLLNLRSHSFTKQSGYENAIVIDLWNIEKPIQTLEEFSDSMRALIVRERLDGGKKFLINPAGKVKAPIKDNLAVMVQFHVRTPLKECLDAYQKLNAVRDKTLTDYKNVMKKSAQDALNQNPKPPIARPQPAVTVPQQVTPTTIVSAANPDVTAPSKKSQYSWCQLASIGFFVAAGASVIATSLMMQHGDSTPRP